MHLSKLEHREDVLLGLHAHGLVLHLAVFEHHESGHAHDAVLLRDVGALVDVELVDGCLAGRLPGGRVDSANDHRIAMAAAIGRGTADPVVKQFAAALERSNRLMAEDLYREAGYMLPQSRNTHELLMSMVSDDDKLPEDFPKEAARRLLDLLEVNE